MQTAGHSEGGREERRHLTVMFCDVVGSTRLSGRQDIEAYFATVRAYYEACEPVVVRHGGLVAQHQGDGIFVWFGYPTPRDDDAVRAVRAGLDLLAVLRHLSQEMEDVVGERLAVRMAAHAGEVLVAPIDGELMPVAFGHTPNIAAKLQQSARPDSFVISETVRHLVGDAFELTSVEPMVVGGAVVPLHEVVAERGRVDRVGQRWTSPLIGRETEQDLLRSVWTAASHGAGRAVVVTGERGIGKTRLASTLAADAAEGGALVLEHACHEGDEASAFRVLRELVGRAAGIASDDPPELAAERLRAHLVDELGMTDQPNAILHRLLELPLGAAAAEAELDPVRLAQVTSEHLVEWLGRLAGFTPTLVLVDDVPFADASSTAVLAHVAAAGLPGLLVVLTARSDRPPSSLIAPGVVDEVELKPLAPSSAAELVDAVEASVATTLEAARRAQVLMLGDGVPLYLEELARAEIVATGALPATLAGRIEARLRAPGMDRQVLDALAVVGQAVELATLASILDLDPDVVRARLDPLVIADLVTWAGSTGTSVRFRHGLLAEAAYDLLLSDQRAELHGRIATALEAMPARGRSVDWIVVGHHLRRAGHLLDAFEAYMTGADQARRAGATSEALLAYGDALDIVAAVTDPSAREVLEVRCRLQRGIAAVSAQGFGADVAVEDFGRCSELCRTMGPRPEHLTAFSGVYSYYLLQGDLHEARAIVEDLRTWVETTNIAHRPENDLGFGVLSFFQGHYADAVDQLRTAVARPTALVDTRAAEQDWLLPFDPYVMAQVHLGASLWVTGRPRAGQEAADLAITHAATLPFPEGPFSMAYAKAYRAWMSSIGGYHDTAARLAGEVREIGVRHGFAFWETTGEIHLAINEHRLTGRPDALDTVLLHASIWELIRARVFLPYVLTAAAAMRAEVGSLADAEADFAAAGALAEQTGALFFEAERLRLLAAVLPADRSDEATALRTRALVLAEEQGATVFALRAALDLARAGAPDGVDHLAAAVARFPAGAGYAELNEAQALLTASASA
jgi:class 3 adenylate cyclase